MNESLEEFRNKRIAEGDQYQKNMELFIEDMIKYGKENFPERQVKSMSLDFAQIVVWIDKGEWYFVDGLAEEFCIADFVGCDCDGIHSYIGLPEIDGMYRLFCTVEYDQDIGAPWDMCEPDNYLNVYDFEKIGG